MFLFLRCLFFHLFFPFTRRYASAMCARQTHSKLWKTKKNWQVLACEPTLVNCTADAIKSHSFFFAYLLYIFTGRTVSRVLMTAFISFFLSFYCCSNHGDAICSKTRTMKKEMDSFPAMRCLSMTCLFITKQFIETDGKVDRQRPGAWSSSSVRVYERESRTERGSIHLKAELLLTFNPDKNIVSLNRIHETILLGIVSLYLTPFFLNLIPERIQSRRLTHVSFLSLSLTLGYSLNRAE